MPLRPLPFRQVDRRLRAAGFVPATVHGSHVKYIREAAGHVLVVIVPRHREIAVGTLRSIVRQAGLTVAEFERLAP
jgi:predicted RNA binding protein YcfA (HicA-like mRNA interferase family)